MAVGTRFFQSFSKALRTDPTLVKHQLKAMQWYRNQAKRLVKGLPKSVAGMNLYPKSYKDELADYYTERRGIERIKSLNHFSNRLIGRMIMFKYDALTKKKLPYWDALPVVLPVKMMPKIPMKRGGPGISGAGFLGLNLHYLPPNIRARFMDAIYDHYKGKQASEGKRLDLSYRLLNTTTSMKAFKPCVKHYLYRQIKSSFNMIHPAEWDFVMMLPLARWQKASETRVYKDSKRKIGI